MFVPLSHSDEAAAEAAGLKAAEDEAETDAALEETLFLLLLFLSSADAAALPLATSFRQPGARDGCRGNPRDVVQDHRLDRGSQGGRLVEEEEAGLSSFVKCGVAVKGSGSPLFPAPLPPRLVSSARPWGIDELPR